MVVLAQSVRHVHCLCLQVSGTWCVCVKGSREGGVWESGVRSYMWYVYLYMSFLFKDSYEVNSSPYCKPDSVLYSFCAHPIVEQLELHRSQIVVP